MSETQESNFSPKTHRRVTIEHDINRLQSESNLRYHDQISRILKTFFRADMSRVDKTRSLFGDVDRLS